MKNSEFKSFHPFVNLIYFVFAVGFSCILLHPAFLLVSLITGLCYSYILNGKSFLRRLLNIFISMVFMGLINPLFNHQGATILTYFPSGNPLTKESLMYGAFTGVMIASVLLWFGCFNCIFTTDKIIYLFGKLSPSLSLIFSMTLRFVPNFSNRLKHILKTQKTLGKALNSGSILERAKNGLSVISILTTWALESSVTTADSMKARGFGTAKRTFYSRFTFTKKDLSALIYILTLGAYVLAGIILKKASFEFFPVLKWESASFFSTSLILAYIMLLFFPVGLEILEVRKWKS